MTTAAALLAVGTPATSVWPLDGLPAQGGQLFSPQPQLNGQTVSACSGMSPLQNTCASGLSSDACALTICWPNVVGGLGYTGTITAYVWGQDRFGVQRYVAWGCSYVADTSISAGGVVSGGCSPSTNAPYECNMNPNSGQTECGNYLWPPFTLRGVATPPVSGSAAVGQWTTSVQRS